VLVLLLLSAYLLIRQITVHNTRSTQFHEKKMLAHLTTEVPLKKGDFQPSRETKSKNNIVLRFYFLLLSYSSWMCTWLRLSIHHPRRNYITSEIFFSFNQPFILIDRFGASLIQTLFSKVHLLFFIFFLFHNIF
jgi:hypothetical protein